MSLMPEAGFDLPMLSSGAAIGVAQIDANVTCALIIAAGNKIC
jgi:hypothetical protein